MFSGCLKLESLPLLDFSSVTNINFRGGESIGSIGQNNNPPVQCPTCSSKVAFKGDTVELSGKKKRTGLKVFLATLGTAAAAFGTLAWLGKSGGKLANLGDGKMKKVVENLKIDKAAEKCNNWWNSGSKWLKENLSFKKWRGNRGEGTNS